jgi:drug/metabolite transporter (DMT)-like permease
VIFSPLGDALLSRGMKRAGSIDVHHLSRLFVALSDPFIIFGIIALIIGMAGYMSALSFADLSYVLPATAVSYVVMVLLSIIWLHERVGYQRWAGVAFIVLGVGIVAGGPPRTSKPPEPVAELESVGEPL